MFLMVLAQSLASRAAADCGLFWSLEAGDWTQFAIKWFYGHRLPVQEILSSSQPLYLISSVI